MNVDNRFMERHFGKRPAKERLNVYTQNLAQMLTEERVDLSELIDMCEDCITDTEAEIRRTTK